MYSYENNLANFLKNTIACVIYYIVYYTKEKPIKVVLNVLYIITPITLKTIAKS